MVHALPALWLRRAEPASVGTGTLSWVELESRAVIWVSLLERLSKEERVDVAARLSSKGQITIPKSVREALGLTEGDQVLFRVLNGGRAIVARTPGLLELGGSVSVPPKKRGLPWEEVRRQTRAARARARR